MIASRTRGQLWRFGAIAVFCGLPLVLLGATVSNVMDATQAAEEGARKQASVSMIVAQLEKHRARAVTPVDIASLYLTSTSDSLARAEIQERVTKLVAQSGGQLSQVQLVATPEQEAAGTVAIQLSMDIDNKGLLDLLYAIESDLPLLGVTDLSAQRNNDPSKDPESDEAALRVDMTVQAHWKKNAG